MALVRFARHLFSGYYNIFLISLVMLFILRPYGRGIVYLAIWKGCLMVVLFSAIFNCKHHRSIRRLVVVLGIPTFLLTWANLYDTQEELLLINALFTVVFIACVTASILYDVILRARVTLETLRGVICAYFMVAIAFAYLYYFVEFLLPGTIAFTTRQVSVHAYNNFFSEMLYFSFVTLLTIGYGDIVAAGDVGQTIAVIEGIIGQFYIAILVARLVSVYSFYGDKRWIKLLKDRVEK